MSYQPHVLFAMGGTLKIANTDDEIWESTLRMGPANGTISGADCDTWLANVQASLKSWFQAANTRAGSNVKLDYIKLNPIGADGRYSDPVGHTYFYATPGVGATTTTGLPSFCCNVYSWVTSKRVGRGVRGRMYFPNTGNAVSSLGGIISSADQSTAATAAHDLLALLVAVTQSGWVPEPAIISRTGEYNKITGVNIGNVIDVQRRRKNRIHETYVSRTFP